MTEKTLLKNPEEIVLRQDIVDPDSVLDQMIKGNKGRDDNIARLQAIKLLDHSAKTKWLLSLPERPMPTDRMEPASGCAIVVITVTVAVIIGWTIYNGIRQAIIRNEQRQKEVMKCTGGGSGGNQGGGSGDDNGGGHHDD